MSKATLRLGLGLAVVALGTAACSPGGGDDGEAPTTLTVLSNWTSGTPQRDILADVVADFEEKTGITVEITEAGEDIPNVFETSVIGGEEADVVIVNLAENTIDWVQNGAAVAAEGYLDEWGLRDRINPDALQAWENADGDVQGFPYQGFVWPVWYNMDLLAQAGIDSVPQSVDELYAATEALTAADIPTMVVGGVDWSGQKLFLQVAQSFMSPEEAMDVFQSGQFCSSDNAMRGIELFTEMRDAGVFVRDVEGYTADQMNATFFEGNAAIMPAGSWAFTDAPEGLNVELGGLPVPDGGTYDKPTAYQGYTGSGFWISQNGAENIDAVRQFISAFYEPDVAGRFTSEANTPTAVVSDQALSINNALLAQATNELPDRVDFAVMPDTYVPGAVADPLIRQTSAAFAPGSDASAICSAIESVYP